MSEVEIILATYNGMKYLQEQVESIDEQSYRGYELTVHDDGSSDGTGEYLEGLHLNNGAVRVIAAPPAGGASANFSLLLKASRAPYVFCSDQDDIWLPKKVERLLELMKFYEGVYGDKTPLLIHTDLRLIDGAGVEFAPSYWQYTKTNPRWGDRFNLLLTQNAVTGCTTVVNRALVEKALPVPAGAVMHDWWLALVACAFGRVIWSEEPTVLYRQHGNNEIGAKKFDLRYLLSKLSTLSDRSEARRSLRLTAVQAAAFAERFPDTPQGAQARFYAALPQMSVWQRRRTIVSEQFYKVGVARNLGWLGLT